jgi:hypothetical protein
MFRLNCPRSAALVAAALLSNGAGAQVPQQILKDVWVATSQELLEVDFAERSVGSKLSGGGAFQALAFEPPVLGTTSGAERGLVGVDGTVIRRYENTSTVVVETWNVDAAAELPREAVLPRLRVVTGVAATDEGTVLITGYSKPKRVYELWEYFPPGSAGGARFVERLSGTPQLVDIVFVPPEDVVGSQLDGGGLLATAGKQVLFFPKDDAYQTVAVIADAKSLGLKGATELTSADLVRETNRLIVATTARRLITAPPIGATGDTTAFAAVPGVCSLKPQRLLVRNLEAGEDGSSVVSDPCGGVLVYDYASTTAAMPAPAPTFAIPQPGLTALAVADGNEVTCTPNEPCPLISRTDPTADYDAFTATIASEGPTQLIVLQYPDLCDPRIDTAPCHDPAVLGDGTLRLNPLLPDAVQEALGGADITIPPYMLSAAYDGSFGVVFVQADTGAFSAPTTIELEIGQLIGYELNVEVGLPRLPANQAEDLDPERLLNQDVAAYAPDNESFPTVDGYEATPITTGWKNPMLGALRGFSAIIYGLQHDVFPASPRVFEGFGIPEGDVNVGGAQPLCRLELGSQVYDPGLQPHPQRYFLNLIACLFNDEERMFTEVIPPGVFEDDDFAAMQTALDQVKDKLIKALSGAGPNTGSETFQAVQSQLNQFEALVAATPLKVQIPPEVGLDPYLGLGVYKNELLVRAGVLRFNIVERAIPSIPIGGFPN